MTPDERDRMNDLCAQILVEKDPQRFSELVEALNELLELKEVRLEARASE
jgi:hypothetical protein